MCLGTYVNRRKRSLGFTLRSHLVGLANGKPTNVIQNQICHRFLSAIAPGAFWSRFLFFSLDSQLACTISVYVGRFMLNSLRYMEHAGHVPRLPVGKPLLPTVECSHRVWIVNQSVSRRSDQSAHCFSKASKQRHFFSGIRR